jgi:DNA primase
MASAPPPARIPKSSPRLKASSLVRGARSELLPREALILQTLVNHPWLLENHAEDIAGLEFRHPDADRLCRILLEAAASHATQAEAIRRLVSERGLSGVLARVQASLTHGSDWPAREGAAPDDVERWFVHVLTLHRKSGALHRELKDAERALGSEPSEENLAWLRDVQDRLMALDGTEAEIDGFGASSGRAVRSL